MRDIKPAQKCLLKLWFFCTAIIATCFVVTHKTMHHHDWEALILIITGITIYMFHHARDVLPSTEKKWHLKQQSRYD